VLVSEFYPVGVKVKGVHNLVHGDLAVVALGYEALDLALVLVNAHQVEGEAVLELLDVVERVQNVLTFWFEFNCSRDVSFLELGILAAHLYTINFL